MDHRQGDKGESRTSVRGLPLPGLLIDLLAAGRWRHPGDDVVREVIPWFESPLVFLISVGQMSWESQSLDLFADESRGSELFREVRGSVAGAVELPWLDVELAFFVAVNRMPGDDVAIALDYRSDPSDAGALGLLAERPVVGFPAGEAGGKVV